MEAESKKSMKNHLARAGDISIFACSRRRVQPVAPFWALSAHECIDFKVISVISVTLHTMKSYFEIVWKDSCSSIFSCSLMPVAFSKFIFSVGAIRVSCIFFQVREKTFRCHHLWKFLHLSMLGLVHLIMCWHFKVLVEGSALTSLVSRTAVTFAADKC